MKRLAIVIVGLCFTLASHAMEPEQPETQQVQPKITLTDKIINHCRDFNADTVKAEFNSATHLDKFSFHEKFVLARLAKMSKWGKDNPRRLTTLRLALQEQLQSQSQLLKNACPFITKLTAIRPLKNLSTESIVYSTVISSDSKTLFSGSGDGTINIWNVDDPHNPTLITKLTKCNDIVVGSLALSNDQKTLFSGSDDCTIKIWNVANLHHPTLITTIDNSKYGHTDWVTSLALSSDQKTLISGSCDTTIKIWNISNLQNPTLITTLDSSKQGHTDGVTSLALSSDQKTLFSGSDDCTIKIWNISDLQNAALITTLDYTKKGHTDRIKSLALNGDQKILFSGSDDSAIKIWNISDLQNATLITTLDNLKQDHTYSVTSLALSSDQKNLFSASYDKTIKIWNVADPQNPTLIITLDKLKQGHTDIVYSLAFSSDQKTLFSGSYDTTIKIWDNSAWTSICVPTLQNYFAKLPTSIDGIIEYFFIKELLQHREEQEKRNSTIIKPLVITDPLLTELFKHLPSELQQECINKNYIAFKVPTYRPITQLNNNNNNNAIGAGKEEQT